MALRCDAPYAVWLAGLAAHCQCPASTVLAVALERYADSVQYPARPPLRLSGRQLARAKDRFDRAAEGDRPPQLDHQADGPPPPEPQVAGILPAGVSGHPALRRPHPDGASGRPSVDRPGGA